MSVSLAKKVSLVKRTRTALPFEKEWIGAELKNNNHGALAYALRIGFATA